MIPSIDLSSPLITLRSYLGPFDPDYSITNSMSFSFPRGSTYGSMVTLPALRDRMPSSSSAAGLDKQSPLLNSHRRRNHLRVQTLRLDSATPDSEEDDDEEFLFDFNEY